MRWGSVARGGDRCRGSVLAEASQPAARILQALVVVRRAADPGQVVVNDALGEVVGLDRPPEPQQDRQGPLDLRRRELGLLQVGLDQVLAVVWAAEVHHRRRQVIQQRTLQGDAPVDQPTASAGGIQPEVLGGRIGMQQPPRQPRQVQGFQGRDRILDGRADPGPQPQVRGLRLDPVEALSPSDPDTLQGSVP